MLNWYHAMYGAGMAMPEAEKRELLEWEAKNLDGCAISTSDWPGWKKYVGDKPVFSDDDCTRDRFGFVYLVRAQSGEYKIGQSKDVDARMRDFATVSPSEFELVHKFPADDRRIAEGLLHQRHSAKRIRREWFCLSEADVKEISQFSAFIDGSFVK